ncbi:family 43 glycosylhydrolase [Bifidobacterium sp. ESL0704]|uniref:family 43 glycosylhydrolase n=1 Tax=Bifidobacterium sp. ESL0704 TaxID=2983219 RepID=UPI0023F9991B|nr:family 43 glycosylhydrolase [Bifidobacterium sp. ESL0704]WEV52130.1 family 43 glycosylhydrolase [Bifidobacterium sp. ESL0704]
MKIWKKAVALAMAAPMLLTMTSTADAAQIGDPQDTHAAPVGNETGANGYLWLHFKATDYEKVNFGYSADGYHWKALNDGNAVMDNPSGTKGLRDPHLLRLHQPDSQGNKYVMIGTDLHAEGTAHGGSWDQISASKNLVVAKSKDLVKWTTPKLVSTGLEGKVGNAWAPEAIWDDETNDYLVYWASRDLSTGGAHPTTSNTSLKIYKAHTADFNSFRNPTKWIDQSSIDNDNIIDTTIVRGDDGDYYRFSTSDWWTVVDVSPTLEAAKWTRLVERDNAINASGVSKVTGDRVVSTTQSGLTNHIEGLTVYRLPDGTWMAMGDSGGYRGFTIPKLSSLKKGVGFANASGVTFDQRFRHGTVMPLRADEAQAVLAAFGGADQAPVAVDPPGAKPIASYDFEDASAPGKDTSGHGNDLSLHGAAYRHHDGEHGNVLHLESVDAEEGAYAQFPKGLFDGRNKLSVAMDVYSQIDANQFTFTFGKDSTAYYFLKYNSSGELASRITTDSWGHEAHADSVVGANRWHRVTVTIDGTVMTLYCDGEQVAQNRNTGVSVTDLGRGLQAYLGKSFYQDAYFKGSFDNVKVWNRVLAPSEVAHDVSSDPTDLRVEKTAPNNQVLAQRTTAGNNGERNLNLTLDYWTPDGGTNGTKTDISKLSLRFTAPQGSSLSMADGSPVPSTQDLDKPFRVMVRRGDSRQIYNVTAQVLVTPIRVSGQRAPTGEIGRKFFADPQVVAYGGKYYIFPTTDGSAGWSGHEIHAFESSDMVDWTDKGVVVDLAKDHGLMPDGRAEKAWAPAFAVRHGRFYLYFSGNGMVNVAISDPAEGGTITSGYKIQTVKVASSIDPAVFQDPGQPDKWYLTWGQSPGMYAELNDDMKGVKPGTTVTTTATKNIREGSYLTARKDPCKPGNFLYYYSYSIDDTNEPTYRVAYAYVSAPNLSSVKGSDWKYGKEILSKDDSKGIVGTAHHSMVRVPGTDDWYIVYHAFLTDEMRPRGYDAEHGGQQIRTGNKREIRIARMTYDADGQIDVVPVTYGSVPPETTPKVTLSDPGHGVASQGSTLKVGFNRGWKTSKVQWYRRDTTRSAATRIDGATSSAYTTTKADVGKTVFAKAVGENTSGVLSNAQAGTPGAKASKTDELSSDSVVVSEHEAQAPPAEGGHGHAGAVSHGSGVSDVPAKDPDSSRGVLGATGATVALVPLVVLALLLLGTSLKCAAAVRRNSTSSSNRQGDGRR